MLLSPIQNTASKVPLLGWKQLRPSISQTFGKNKEMYSQFGMDGHNGIDYAVPVGTPVFAPCDGVVRIKSDVSGYGKHVKLRSRHGSREIVLGHLSSFNVANDQEVYVGDILGFSGNTGFSTGPHLHFGMRRLASQSNDKDIWSWGIRNYDNGYYGYINLMPYVYTWKGGLTFTTAK